MLSLKHPFNGVGRASPRAGVPVLHTPTRHWKCFGSHAGPVRRFVSSGSTKDYVWSPYGPSRDVHREDVELAGNLLAAATAAAAALMLCFAPNAEAMATNDSFRAMGQLRPGHHGIKKHVGSELDLDVLSAPPVTSWYRTASLAATWPFSAPPWLSLLGLLALNVAGLSAVLQVVRAAQDGGDVTVVTLQVGLLTNSCDIQDRISKLSAMGAVGQTGTWIILEEAVLELLKYKSAARYASADVAYLNKKSAGYDEFKKVATQQTRKAEREERVVTHGHPEQGKALFSIWPRDDGEGEAVVVTLVVAARGRLSVPPLGSWSDLKAVLKQFTALTSDRIMAVELLCTPNSTTDSLLRSQMLVDYPQLSMIA